LEVRAVPRPIVLEDLGGRQAGRQVHRPELGELVVLAGADEEPALAGATDLLAVLLDDPADVVGASDCPLHESAQPSLMGRSRKPSRGFGGIAISRPRASPSSSESP
jgi:hypothetical protein